MREYLKTIPNLLTALRLLLLPVLWGLALLKWPVPLAIGMIISFLTDTLDGFIARRFNVTSAFGSKFDSLADNLLIPSTVIWLVILRPEVLTDHPILCAVAVATYGSSLLVGWIKFRRFANLHLYSKKTAGVLSYAFIVHALLAGRYNAWLFYIAISLFILASVEGLILQLTHAQVDEHMGSLVLTLVRRKSTP
ncbi:MAG: CDP-alcohol phosphatidyltransferase [Anaerolineales bacterium]|jgi:phosphatidylglycerophosphate synthase|nr:CDP-alcohol phosphatidyltransferase [Anaerolineales bacterium]MBM2849434.1 CDP-alcohol phosphatidyltransferase [Anaerolineales bacterium]